MPIQKKNVRSPDETRSFDKGKMQLVNLVGASVGLFTLQPGWKWSTSVKPIVKTPSCQIDHLNYIISGRLRVRLDDGSETEVGLGDFVAVPPGHDAWVVGNETCVALELRGATQYGKKGT